MTVAIRQLSVPRMQREVFQGQSVLLTAVIEDAGITSPLLSVDPCTVHIFNPSDEKIVDSSLMTVVSTGVQQITVQTANQPLGVYKATVISHHSGNIAIVEKVPIFKIIRPVGSTDLPTFNVLAIKDQSGAIWYWWIGADDTITWDDEQPVIPGYQPIDIDTVFIPYWLQGLDPSLATRYIYPALDGAPTVTGSSTPLPVGTGLDYIPTFVGLNAGNVYQPFITTDDTVDVVII